jgi:hypothetical protein
MIAIRKTAAATDFRKDSIFGEVHSSLDGDNDDDQDELIDQLAQPVTSQLRIYPRSFDAEPVVSSYYPILACREEEGL